MIVITRKSMGKKILQLSAVYDIPSLVWLVKYCVFIQSVDNFCNANQNLCQTKPDCPATFKPATLIACERYAFLTHLKQGARGC